MHSTEVVLVLIAVTFVFAWLLAYSKGFERGKSAILDVLNLEELKNVATRLGIRLRDDD